MFDFTVLGSSSATPAFGRYLSSFIIRFHHRLFLIDCGEATQLQLNRYRIPMKRIEAIFISHLHGDHIFGLPGLLSTMSMSGRTKKLYIFGPEGIKDYITTVSKLSDSFFVYPIEYFELPLMNDPYNLLDTYETLSDDEINLPTILDKYSGNNDKDRKVIFSHNGLEVSCFPLQHRIPCFGYFFKEIDKKRKFLVEKAHEYEIPKEYFHLIKQGVDIQLPDGRTLESNSFLGDEPVIHSFAYCSDTRYDLELPQYIKNATLLYHEATFLNDLEKQAQATAHSTARQAAQIAKLANVETLVIGHFSARYRELINFLDEAAVIFPKTHLAIEGKTYNIPYENFVF